MLRFNKTKAAKQEFHGAKKTKIWDVDVDNIVITKLIDIRNNFKYLIEYLDDVKTQLVLMLLKMT